MSRVDDDRDAARAAERLALQKRELEQKAKERSAEDSAFSRLVTQSKAEKKQAEAQSRAKSAVEHLLEEASVQVPRGQGRLSQEKGSANELQGRHTQRAQDAQLSGAERDEAHRDAQGGVQRGDEGLAAEVSAEDAAATTRGSEGRKADAKTGEERLAEKGAQSGAGPRGARSGELRADADKGGGGQQGGGDQKPSAEAAASFRLNPALMAPTPIARPKQSGGSERLRALASEIAQKIVERVRVGTNAAGKAEFQIDLRSNVLAGLSIKVSGSGGRISAVFSGRDREVLKLLREQSEGLKGALTARGLTLAEFRIEETP